MKQNPYPAQSLLGKIFDLLKIKERPITVTNAAVALGSTYAAVYRAVYNDKIKAVNFEHRDGVRHIALNAEFKNKEPELSNETIQDVMASDDSEYGLHVHQIAQKAHATQAEVKAFIKEQVGLGNIEVNPTQGKHGHRYRWAGPINAGIKEEILDLAKEVEVESTSEVQLEPTADALDSLPDELPAEPVLPKIAPTEPKPQPIESKNTPTEPETAIKEPEDMTENDVTASNSQADAPAIAAPQLNLKISYMITAAKGKLERRRKLEAAQSLAKRWANEGYKDVTIHLASEYEHARVTSEVQFRRA